jgi:predicted ABC-type ATPase
VDELLDKLPVVIALAGPNGAGKSTFFEAFLRGVGLRFVNPDIIARELQIGAYEAARIADEIRYLLIDRRESFVFETVLSDPGGEKVRFLQDAATQGYTVLLCFIGLDSAESSEQRVAMRVSQGGHDVPTDKLLVRFRRSLANLARAIRDLPCVYVYDNSDLADPFRLLARFRGGKLEQTAGPVPAWFRNLCSSL